MPLANLPTRSFGPCKSARMPIGRPTGGLDRADAADQRAHQLVVGVAHIDAEDVGAGLEELAQHLLAGGGRPDRGENLDVSAASHGVVCLVTAASPLSAGSSVS